MRCAAWREAELVTSGVPLGRAQPSMERLFATGSDATESPYDDDGGSTPPRAVGNIGGDGSAAERPRFAPRADEDAAKGGAGRPADQGEATRAAPQYSALGVADSVEVIGATQRPPPGKSPAALDEPRRVLEESQRLKRAGGGGCSRPRPGSSDDGGTTPRANTSSSRRGASRWTGGRNAERAAPSLTGCMTLVPPASQATGPETPLGPTS